LGLFILIASFNGFTSKDAASELVQELASLRTGTAGCISEGKYVLGMKEI
jgi:hypothetical protein